MGSFFSPSTPEPTFQKLPEFSQRLSTQAAGVLPQFFRPFAQGPFDLSQPSDEMLQAMQAFRGFGAGGLQPFISGLQNIAQTGGMGDLRQTFDDIASRDFLRSARDLRAGAASIGALNNTGVAREMARSQDEIALDLARQYAGLQMQGVGNQLAASQLGLSGIPGALGGLAQTAGLFEDQRSRANQDFYFRNFLGPLQALGLAPQFQTTLSPVFPHQGASPFSDLLNTGLSAYLAYQAGKPPV